MTRLQTRLALHRFVCREFGYDEMEVVALDEDDPNNAVSYELSVARSFSQSKGLESVRPKRTQKGATASRNRGN